MADEEVTPIEEVVTEEAKTEPAQEELPLAAATEEAAETDKPIEAEAAPKEEPSKVEEPPKEDWRDKELKAKHRKLKEAERVLAEKEAEIAARDALLAKFNQGKTTETPTAPVDEIEKRVQQRLAEQRYNEQATKVQVDGEKAYGTGFKEAVGNLEILGGFDMATMEGILATDDPSKVLYELGKNPEKYHSLMALSPQKRIVEMTKLAMAPASKTVSSAPAPVTPVGGRAAPAKETVTDDMDDDKWYAIRGAYKRKRWEQRNGIRR